MRLKSLHNHFWSKSSCYPVGMNVFADPRWRQFPRNPEQQNGPSQPIQSAKIMASGSTGSRVSCGRDLNCVPEIADTLAAVAKLG